MARRFFAAIGALALVAACAQQDETDAASPNTLGWTLPVDGDLNSFLDCLERESATLISAHRGGPYAGYPENALETMAALFEDIPAIMEIDISQSADGVLFLHHDDTLERTTTGSGSAADASWATLKSLKLKDRSGATTPFSLTRFSDALAWADGRTILQIDFKRSASYEDAIDEIKAQDAQHRVVLIAYSLGQARKLSRLAPDAMISLSINSQSELNSAVAAGIPADRLLAFTGTEAPRPRLFSTMDDRDVEVIFGTLGGRKSIDADIASIADDGRYVDIVARGVDILATDRPRESYAALAKAGRGALGGLCGINAGQPE